MLWRIEVYRLDSKIINATPIKNQRTRCDNDEPIMRGQNLIEKIVQKYVDCGTSSKVFQGDFVFIKPHHVMTHDNTAAVIKK